MKQDQDLIPQESFNREADNADPHNWRVIWWFQTKKNGYEMEILFKQIEHNSNRITCWTY